MKIFCAAKSEMMGMTTVFNASGVDKENFVKYTEENPATYRVPVLNIFTRSFFEIDYFISSVWLDPPNIGLVSYLGPGDHWKGRRPEESLSWQVNVEGPPRWILTTTTAQYWQTFSTSFRREFEEARARGVIPPETSNIGGSWSTLTKVGLFDLFTLTLIFGSCQIGFWNLVFVSYHANQ